MPGYVVFLCTEYMWMSESVCLYRINRDNELMYSGLIKLPLGLVTIKIIDVCVNVYYFYYSNRMIVRVEHINTKIAKFLCTQLFIRLCCIHAFPCVCGDFL